MKKIKIPKWLEILASIVLTGAMLFWAGTMVDWNNFLPALRSVELSVAIICFIIFLLAIVVQGIKYWLFVPNVPLSRMLLVYAPANFFFNMPMGAITGPASLMMTLKDYLPPMRIASSLVMDMITKFYAMFVLLLISAIFATHVTIAKSIIALIALVVAVMTLGFWAMRSDKSRDKLLRAISPMKEKKCLQPFYHFLEQWINESIYLFEKKRRVILHLALGLITEVLIALPYYLIARNLGLNIAVHNWLWIHCFVRVICMMPLTAGGLGAREGALVILLGWMGIASAQTMTLSLLYTTLNLLSLCCCGLLFFVKPKEASPSFVPKPQAELQKPQ